MREVKDFCVIGDTMGLTDVEGCEKPSVIFIFLPGSVFEDGAKPRHFRVICLKRLTD
jgi:hypothetical protein